METWCAKLEKKITKKNNHTKKIVKRIVLSILGSQVAANGGCEIDVV